MINKLLLPSALVGLLTIGSSFAATEWAWKQQASEEQAHVFRIAEIYLDGLVASVKASLERDLPGDVERRLRSAMTEQNGIRERAIVILDENNNINIRAGSREAVRDERLKVIPGSYVLDRDKELLFAARKISSAKSTVAVALEVDQLLSAYTTTRNATILGHLLAGILAFTLTLLLLNAVVKRTIRQASAPV